MKAYASESYYIGVYLCGKEPDISAAFDFYAMQATSLMKQYTLDNVDENDIPEEVKMCCCELAENIFKAEQEGGAQGVSSESVGGWSKSYESLEVRRQNADRAVHDIVYKWLSGTGLLYRGVR